MGQKTPKELSAELTLWKQRANAAEHAVHERFFRRLWFLPFTKLALSGKPTTWRERGFVVWNYWWQAHVLDCLVDAYLRDPLPYRRRQIKLFYRSHVLRNLLQLTNQYYDDMAWFGLALERAQRLAHIPHPVSLRILKNQFRSIWSPELGGGIPWRKQDKFFNTPANGPAGILLARLGEIDYAEKIDAWLYDTLLDSKTGLIFDGIESNGKLHTDTFTYCQGVTLGLHTELYKLTGQDKYLPRIKSLLLSIQKYLAKDNIIRTEGGGDGGLFAGILTRYLALVITELPNKSTQVIQDSKKIAADLLFNSANSLWENSIFTEGQLVFPAKWEKTAQVPTIVAGKTAKLIGNSVKESAIPERDLSVQISAWMLLEACYQVSNYYQKQLISSN